MNRREPLIRKMTLDDLDDLYAYASVDGVGQMAGR